MYLLEILQQLFVACVLDFNLKHLILAKFYAYVLVDWMIQWIADDFDKPVKKTCKECFPLT